MILLVLEKSGSVQKFVQNSWKIKIQTVILLLHPIFSFLTSYVYTVIIMRYVRQHAIIHEKLELHFMEALKNLTAKHSILMS